MKTNHDSTAGSAEKVARMQLREDVFSSIIIVVHKATVIAVPFHFLVSVIQLPWLLKHAGLCSVLD